MYTADQSARVIRAHEFTFAKDYKGAIGILEGLMLELPNDISIRITLAFAYEHTNREGAACLLLHDVERLSDEQKYPPVGYLLPKARLQSKLGQQSDALETLKKLLNFDPQNKTALQLQSAIETEIRIKNRVQERRMRSPSRSGSVDRRRRDSRSPRSPNRRHRAPSRSHSRSRSRSRDKPVSMAEAKANRPEADKLVEVGTEKLERCDFAGAAEIYTRIIQLQPFPRHYLSRSWALENGGHFRDALADVRSALNRLNDEAAGFREINERRALLGLARIHMKRGALNAAISAITELLEKHPGFEPAERLRFKIEGKLAPSTAAGAAASAGSSTTPSSLLARSEDTTKSNNRWLATVETKVTSGVGQGPSLTTGQSITTTAARTPDTSIAPVRANNNLKPESPAPAPAPAASAPVAVAGGRGAGGSGTIKDVKMQPSGVAAPGASVASVSGGAVASSGATLKDIKIQPPTPVPAVAAVAAAVATVSGGALALRGDIFKDVQMRVPTPAGSSTQGGIGATMTPDGIGATMALAGWDPLRVGEWFAAVGGDPYNPYRELAVRHALDGDTLASFIASGETELRTALKDIGITSVVHLKVITTKLMKL